MEIDQGKLDVKRKGTTFWYREKLPLVIRMRKNM